MRKIFQTRRSKRPMFMAGGIACLCAAVFVVGFYMGRSHPDLFSLDSGGDANMVAAAAF